MKYDPQKHHRRSIRLNEYDYSQAGAYFVTIVTQQRACLFGEIVDGQMLLNAAGRIVQWEWQRLGQRFPNLQLGPFVVMPNHLHGIIVICADGVGATRRGQNGVGATRQGQNGYPSGMEISPDEASIGNGGSPLRDGKDISPDEAPVGNGGSPQRDDNDGSPVPNGPGPGSLGAVIGQLKSRVTKRIRSQPGMSGLSVWQRNYYEHIIRNADDYYRVQGYIVSNPVDWSDDDENLVRLR
jgi:REP element-mobilizing transposase RayT